MKKMVLGCRMVALAALMSWAVAAMAQRTDEMVKIYGFGLAASFNDSVVYITDIQEIDSAYQNAKTHFLVSRNNYSYQLRDYLAEKKREEHRTCVFFYALNRKEIEKKYLKTKERYTKKGDFDVKFLTVSDFAFKPIAPLEVTQEQPAEPEKKEKKGKKGKDKKKK